MPATEAAYHMTCITNLWNRFRLDKRISKTVENRKEIEGTIQISLEIVVFGGFLYILPSQIISMQRAFCGTLTSGPIQGSSAQRTSGLFTIAAPCATPFSVDTLRCDVA